LLNNDNYHEHPREQIVDHANINWVFYHTFAIEMSDQCGPEVSWTMDTKGKHCS